MSEVFQSDFAGREISLKTHYVAGQADGAVLVQYGDTVVLVTAVSLKSKREGVDFLPLTVDYEEKTFAAGKIPGGFFKREGRPNEREILTSRIIDRSVRPLFPKGYYYETQIVATVLSVDNENDPDVAAMLGCSAALTMSDIAFKGPVAGIRIGRVSGQFVCNPSAKVMSDSDLDIFLVGRKIPRDDGGYDVNPVMLEGGAQEVEEDAIVEAINFGLTSLKPVLELQDRMRAAIGKEKRKIEEATSDEKIVQRIAELATASLNKAYRIPEKL
jgi:polyribonucleotide nucleotidyltransferase